MEELTSNLKRVLFLSFIILSQCDSFDTNEDKMKNILSKKQVLVLTNIEDKFDTILEDKYDMMKDKSDMYHYLMDFKQVLEKEDIYNLEQFIKNDWDTSDFLEALKESNLFKEVYLDDSLGSESDIFLVQKWIDSIVFIDDSMSIGPKDIVHLLDFQLNELELGDINDEPNIEIQESTRYQVYYSDKFYYALYRSLSEDDKKIKNFIISKIKVGDITPLIILHEILSSFSKEELNNKILKQIIYVEFILPFYLNIGMDE